MALSLKTECVICGHSIPLTDTYCGGDECLNRYAADNEHPDYSHQQYQEWKASASGPGNALNYHDWAKALEELTDLESVEFIDHHDQDDIDALRQLLGTTSATA